MVTIATLSKYRRFSLTLPSGHYGVAFNSYVATESKEEEYTCGWRRRHTGQRENPYESLYLSGRVDLGGVGITTSDDKVLDIVERSGAKTYYVATSSVPNDSANILPDYYDKLICELLISVPRSNDSVSFSGWLFLVTKPKPDTAISQTKAVYIAASFITDPALARKVRGMTNDEVVAFANLHATSLKLTSYAPGTNYWNTWWQQEESTPSPLSIEEIEKKLEIVLTGVSKEIPYLTSSYEVRKLEGNCSRKIADKARPYRTNVFSVASQYSEQGIRPTIETVQKALDGNIIAASADVLFESQYGRNLTAADNAALFNSLFKAIDETEVYRAVDEGTIQSFFGNAIVTCSTSATVSLWDDGVRNAIDQAYRIGYMPTLTNAWDLVPFSFVLDWFLPVQEVLDRLDAPGYVASLNAHVKTRSVKISCTEINRSWLNKVFPLDSARLSFSYYERIVGGPFPPYLPSFDGLVVSPRPNWVSASAIALQFLG